MDLRFPDDRASLAFGSRDHRVSTSRPTSGPRPLCLGALAVVAGLIVLFGSFVAIGGYGWVWLVVLANVVAFFWAILLANDCERKALLFRRAVRKAVVDQFARSDEKRPSCSIEGVHLPGEWATTPWDDDERFEEMLLKQCGHAPGFIETPADDNVVLTIEGKVVSGVIDVPSYGFKVDALPPTAPA